MPWIAGRGVIAAGSRLSACVGRGDDGVGLKRHGIDAQRLQACDLLRCQAQDRLRGLRPAAAAPPGRPGAALRRAIQQVIACPLRLGVQHVQADIPAGPAPAAGSHRPAPPPGLPRPCPSVADLGQYLQIPSRPAALAGLRHPGPGRSSTVPSSGRRRRAHLAEHQQRQAQDVIIILPAEYLIPFIVISHEFTSTFIQIYPPFDSQKPRQKP